MAAIFELDEEVIYIKLQYKFEKDQMKNENATALTLNFSRFSMS